VGRRRGKGGEETRQGGYLLLPTIHRSIYLGRRFGGGIGGRGGEAAERGDTEDWGKRALFSFSLHHDGRGVGGIWTVWMGLFGLRFTPALYSTFKFFCFGVVS